MVINDCGIIDGSIYHRTVYFTWNQNQGKRRSLRIPARHIFYTLAMPANKAAEYDVCSLVVTTTAAM